MGLFLGTLILAFVLITFYLLYMEIKPFFVSFSAFKFICSLGKKASISQNSDFFKDNFKYEYVDELYNVWRRELKARGSMTESENLALQKKTLKEMDAEIKRLGID